MLCFTFWIILFYTFPIISLPCRSPIKQGWKRMTLQYYEIYLI